MISPQFLSRYPLAPPTDKNDLNILSFGAVGDGQKMNTVALQKAIDTCSQKGGGRLIVPKGNFLTGTFFLKSNVNLHLEEGGVILGSPYMKDYPKVFNPSDKERKHGFQTLVCSMSQSKVMISGPGTINGNAQQDSTGEFRDTGNNDPRPPLFLFEDCKDVTIKDITFRQSLMWTAIFDHCEHLWIDGVKINENYYYNADGLDILDCTDFLIENCVIDTDDDGICLKSNSGGCLRGVVRNNKIRSLCNAIKMGTSSSAGFKSILIENNQVWQTVISGVALQIVDGGLMDDIVVRNIKMDGVGTPISLRLGDRRGPGQTHQIGIMRNVHISNIEAVISKAIKYNKAEENHHPYPPHVSSICGIPGHLIENVTIENVTITSGDGFPAGTAQDTLREIPEVEGKYPENRMFGMLPAYGFYVRHARNITFKNIQVTMKQEDGRPAFLLDDVHGAELTGLKGINPKPTQLLAVRPGCSRIMLG